MCFSAHEYHSAQACGKKKEKKKKSCSPQVEVPLLQGRADSCTAGAEDAECIALWVFSLLAWERMSYIQSSSEVAVQETPALCW